MCNLHISGVQVTAQSWSTRCGQPQSPVLGAGSAVCPGDTISLCVRAEGRRPITRMLTSVYDKTGLVELAQALHGAGCSSHLPGSS